MFYVVFRILLLAFYMLTVADRLGRANFTRLLVIVVSVRRCFLFLLVLEIGCVNLLWHSLGIPF